MLDLLVQNVILLDLNTGAERTAAVGVDRGFISCVIPAGERDNAAADQTAASNSGNAGTAQPMPEARRTIDGQGSYLFPGLVDFHTHLFRHGSQFGIDADLLLSSGVTTAADMGSAGWVNYPAMYECDLIGKKVRTGSFLNISPIGQPGRGISEPLDAGAVSEEGIDKILTEYPGKVRGLKVRLSRSIVKELGTGPLRRAVELGEKFGLPVCVHTTDPPAPTDEVAAMLRPGDIYSHTYQGVGHHSAETDEVLKGMLAAQERGVLIEVGNGRVNFDFPVAEKCIEAGLLPDIISSDATPQTYHNGPAMWDLARVASKFLNMGVPIQNVVRAVTSTPARVLRMDHMIGTVAPGFEADLALFRMKDDPITFCDSAGNERIGAEGLVPVMTIRSGRVVWQQF